MPGKKFKSIGIREKLYNRIEEEKREGESMSDYIERVIDIATEREEEKGNGKDMVTTSDGTEKLYEAIEALREDLSLRDGKELVTGIATDKEGIKELSDKDIKRIAGQMELAIGMYIETGIAKGMKALQR